MKTADRQINRMVWSPAEQSIISRFPDLNSVSSLAATLLGVVTGTITVLSESVGDPKRLSPGARLCVQASPALRAQLDVEAAQQGVSVSEWATQKLAMPAGPAAAHHAGHDGWRLSAVPPRC
jgi:hypothetical protein